MDYSLGHAIDGKAGNNRLNQLNVPVKLLPCDILIKNETFFYFLSTLHDILGSCLGSNVNDSTLFRIQKRQEGICHVLCPVYISSDTNILRLTSTRIVDKSIQLLISKFRFHALSSCSDRCLIANIDLEQLNFSFALCIFFDQFCDSSIAIFHIAGTHVDVAIMLQNTQLANSISNTSISSCHYDALK